MKYTHVQLHIHYCHEYEGDVNSPLFSCWGYLLNVYNHWIIAQSNLKLCTHFNKCSRSCVYVCSSGGVCHILCNYG